MLKGLKVLQFQGLAPSVFCGMYFSDQGAQVILVNRPDSVPFLMPINKNIMNRNKKSIVLSLKNQQDKNIIKQLIKQMDIIIDPYRPGVLQKLGLGPEDLQKINPKIILLRVTGYGQFTQMALKPGHDLNYISSSGILGIINPPQVINNKKQKIQFPMNYVADFLGASIGIVDTLNALNNRQITQKGAVVDCSLADGSALLTKIFEDNKEKFKIKPQNQRKVDYIQVNNQRYVISSKKNTKQEQIKKQQLTSIIMNMQKNNQKFQKINQTQIAQIVKIKGIKQSRQILVNPFSKIQNTDDSIYKSKLPELDQHRDLILKNFKILPKL